MTQDGRAQVVPENVSGPRRLNLFVCGCGGSVLCTRGPFARCSGCGTPYCTRCRRPAHRFRKGLTCGVGCVPA